MSEADKAFDVIVNELSTELGEKPAPEELPLIRRIFDAGVNFGKTVTENDQ